MLVFQIFIIIISFLICLAIIIVIALDKNSVISRTFHGQYSKKVFIIVFSIFASLLITFLFILFFSSQLLSVPPSPTPTPSVSPPPFNCPTPQQVSAWMRVTVSNVNEIGGCAFHAGDNGEQISGVICTNRDGGATIEYTPVGMPKTLVVRDCDGKQLPDIWNLTIRFVRGYPQGDASVCAIVQKEHTRHPDLRIEPHC
jgi:hypothetical protein